MVLLSGALVLAGCGRGDVDRERSRGFQQAVGGLGVGPTLDLSRGRRAFDPRLGAEPFGPRPAARAVGARLAGERDDE